MDVPCACPVTHMLNHPSSWRGKVVKALRRRQVPQIGTEYERIGMREYERNWKGAKSQLKTRERKQGRVFAVCTDAQQLIL